MARTSAPLPLSLDMLVFWLLGTVCALRAALVTVISLRLEVAAVANTIKSFEDNFNHQFHYDWVVMLYRQLSVEAKQTLVSVSSGTIRFVEIRHMGELLTYRKGTDREKVRKLRLKIRLPKSLRKVSLIQNRHLTRFLLGHYYNLDGLWDDYDYYMKVPVELQLECTVDYDVFQKMKDEGIKYGWLLAQTLPEQMHPTLMQHVQEYVLNPNNAVAEVPSQNNFHFLLDNATLSDPEKPNWGFSGCAYDTLFELVDVLFFRSPQYQHFFNYIDEKYGFYYETWREDHIKTVATSLFLLLSEVRFFDDLAVSTAAKSNCPLDLQTYVNKKCTCNPFLHGQEYTITRLITDVHEVMHSSQCVAHYLRTTSTRSKAFSGNLKWPEDPEPPAPLQIDEDQ